MDNIDELQQIDDAFEALPPEVKTFLYDGAFEQAIAAITKTYVLSQDKIDSLRYHAMMVVILIEHRDDLVKLCQGWGFDDARQQAFMDDVEKLVIMPVIQATNYVVEDNTESASTTNAPSPAEVLASLKARMTTPTAIAPVSRELTSGPAPAATPIASVPVAAPATPAPAAPKKKPAFDIYREQV